MKRKLFTFLVGIVLSVCAVQKVFAVDVYIVELYKQIDGAFSDKSDRELDAVLSNNNEDSNYYLLENYTMKKIRRLVIDKEYDFALQSNLIVIDNNLDNAEAVEMYSVIAAALEQQKLKEAEEKARSEKEAAALEAEKEKKKVVAVKEYTTVKNAEGTDVFVASKNERYTAQNWKAMFGMANAVFVTESSGNYDSFRYGISGNFVYDYYLNKFVVGIDTRLDVIMLPFTNADDTILMDLSVVPELGFTGLNGNLLFRLGFASLFDFKMGKNNTSILQDNIFSPVLGIGFNKIKLGEIDFSGYFDYYLGHLAYENLNAAMKAELNFGIPIMEMDKIKLSFNIGVKDTLFIKTESVENRAGLVLAFGVENVAK